MGYLHYLVNHQNKTAYECGKTLFYTSDEMDENFDYPVPKHHTVEEVRQFLKDRWTQAPSVLNRVAPEIFAFRPDEFIGEDQASEPIYNGYTITGSVFPERNSIGEKLGEDF